MLGIHLVIEWTRHGSTHLSRAVLEYNIDIVFVFEEMLEANHVFVRKRLMNFNLAVELEP